VPVEVHVTLRSVQRLHIADRRRGPGKDPSLLGVTHCLFALPALNSVLRLAWPHTGFPDIMYSFQTVAILMNTLGGR